MNQHTPPITPEEAAARLEKMEEANIGIEFTIPPSAALMLIGQLQRALRHPGNVGISADITRELAEHLVTQIEKLDPELGRIGQMGFDPTYDEPAPLPTASPPFQRTLVIEDEQQNPLFVFPSLPNKLAAKALWCFLVDNLQPGFIVVLRTGPAELTRRSGHKIPTELYNKVMGIEEVGEGEEE